MTSREVSRIQSDLDEMEKGLGEFFLGACKIHGEGTYKMARNQKRIIGILKKVWKAHEEKELFVEGG